MQLLLFSQQDMISNAVEAGENLCIVQQSVKCALFKRLLQHRLRRKWNLMVPWVHRWTIYYLLYIGHYPVILTNNSICLLTSVHLAVSCYHLSFWLHSRPAGHSICLVLLNLLKNAETLLSTFPQSEVVGSIPQGQYIDVYAEPGLSSNYNNCL